MTVRISSPAHINRMSANAISETTRKLRNRVRCIPLLSDLPSALSASVKFGFELCHAGTKPQSNAVIIDKAKVKPSAGRLSSTVWSWGSISLPKVFNKSTLQIASSNPSPAPVNASKALSVSAWRNNRQRDAPRAVRMLISDACSVERASSRFATFAHAIKSTNATAPNSSHNVFCRSRTVSSCKPTRWIPQLVFDSGCCASKRCAMVLNSDWACCTVTPSFSRPIARRWRAERILSLVSSTTGR